MDQTKAVFDYDRNCTIDINQLIKFAGHEKKKVARRRWAILAKALKSPSGSEPSSPTDECSVRRISSFMLLETQQLPNVPLISSDPRLLDQLNKRTWYCYSTQIENTRYFVNVGHRNRTFSAEDLMGFNNTGNICIWPSEETLTYYVCNNLSIFRGKTVLELGGGMSCLAGLFAAKYGGPKSVTVSDGNKTSVENVQTTLQCNKFDCPVDCKVLKWNDTSLVELYDVILCADCLFFDDARNDLIECLWRSLSTTSVALVMAPERGNTLESFIERSEKKGFSCTKIANYNEAVWSKRLALLDNVEFNDNIHYPILIEVTKLADYWVSQERKYCEFCKCWIADNRPSVEFHEKGKRHQENVKKKLKNITKNSFKAQKESQRTDYSMKQMERAALEAYKKDIENNADLTSIAINQKLKDENLEIKGTTKKWYELKSKEGHLYYWNTVTNETVWEPPKEGYLTQEEQREESFLKTKTELVEVDKEKRKRGLLHAEQLKKEEEEERARLEREKMKERRVVDDISPEIPGPIIEPGNPSPYGIWKTVKETPFIDLQLPEQEYYEPPVTYEPEPVVREFKEKTVDSLDGPSGETTFKKRKINFGNKKNARQRLDNN